jgi:anaerobic selenocysteine-containing dehydrogenase
LQANDVLVEINPASAKEYGLKDGSFAVLRTPKGKARVKVRHYDGIGPGVIAIPRGLGHTAYDKFLAGKGVNFNTLIGSTEDPASGHDAAWGIRARLTKA